MTEPKHDENAGARAPAEVDGGRRGALRALVLVGGAVYGGAIAVPAVAFVTGGTSGAGESRARWVRVGRLADLDARKPSRLQIIGDQRDAFTVSKNQVLGSVWLHREGDGVRALSSICPHLGCSIDLAADAAGFACPCHASRFSLDGAAESGPAPRSMDPLTARVVDGFVEVDFRRFRVGISERKEAGG